MLAAVHIVSHIKVDYLVEDNRRYMAMASNILLIIFPLLFPDGGEGASKAIINISSLSSKTQLNLCWGLLALALILDLILSGHKEEDQE